MAKKFFIFSLLCLLAIAAQAQSQRISGAWTGKLNVLGGELRLVFHLDDGACSMDSPDQSVKGIPAKLERSERGVKVSVPSINASFEGEYRDSLLVGTFSQHGQSFPLTLAPGEKRLSRPQTPVGPFPYQMQEVSFSNGDAVLKGTLVTPHGCTRETPVLLMVTGSGLQNRDEEIFEHKPFAVIADALARKGIATLRYDDRGFGESSGDLVQVTTEDLKNDALAGVSLLRGRFDHVGVLGHSEGGTIALMLAEEGKADFVVSLAGNIVSGEKTLLEQNRRELQEAGYAQNVVDGYCQSLESLFDALKAGKDPEVPSLGLPAGLLQNLKAVKAQSSTPYMRYFLALDISDSLGKISCPVLALNGTLDSQVNCEENLSLLRDRLRCPKEIHAVEGVNHLFQHCKRGDFSEYNEIEETFAPEVLTLIADWMQQFK